MVLKNQEKVNSGNHNKDLLFFNVLTLSTRNVIRKKRRGAAHHSEYAFRNG